MLIAHDLGTTGDKAPLHDYNGHLTAAVTETYPTYYGRGGVVKQDPEQWWNAVCAAARRLLATAGVSSQQILGVGLSGKMMANPQRWVARFS